MRSPSQISRIGAARVSDDDTLQIAKSIDEDLLFSVQFERIEGRRPSLK